MKGKKKKSGVKLAGQGVNYDDSRSSIEVRSTNRQVLDRLYNDLASKAGVLGKLDSTLSRDEDGTYVRRLKDRSYVEYKNGGIMRKFDIGKGIRAKKKAKKEAKGKYDYQGATKQEDKQEKKQDKIRARKKKKS